MVEIGLCAIIFLNPRPGFYIIIKVPAFWRCGEKVVFCRLVALRSGLESEMSSGHIRSVEQ